MPPGVASVFGIVGFPRLQRSFICSCAVVVHFLFVSLVSLSPRGEETSAEGKLELSKEGASCSVVNEGVFSHTI